MFISRYVLDSQDFEDKILVLLSKFKILKKRHLGPVKRQLCVVEQYSNFSQQKHLSDSILQNTIFILELEVRTPLCGGDTFSFLGQKKN